MARKVANTDIITDSFEIWLLQTNELLNSLSTEIMTANATYANTGNSTFDRNAQLYGTFGANTMAVTNWLKGGNIGPGSFANLMISTNTVLSNTNAANLMLMVANGTVFSYINPFGGYFGNTTANSFINSTAIITQSNSIVNTNISPTLIQIANSTSTANIVPTSFKTGLFTGNTISVSVGANVIANAESLTVGNSTVNTFIVSNSTMTLLDTDGYMRVLGNADFSNSMLVVGNATFQNTMLVVGNTNLQNTLTVTGLSTLNGNMNTPTGNASVAFNVGANVNLTTDRINVGNNSVNTFVTSTAIETDGTLTVLGATTLSNTLDVTGATTLSNTLSVGGISTFKTDYVVDVSSNADIGSTIGAVLIYRFPKATYSSGKFEIQIKNGNTQLSEMVLAHDAGLNSYVTVYGTVASNGGVSPLGTFTSNTDTANVNLYLVQTVANSAVKVVAHLIK